MSEEEKSQKDESQPEKQHNQSNEPSKEESENKQSQPEPEDKNIRQEPPKKQIGQIIYKILNLLTSVSLIISAQIQVIFNYLTVSAWFRYLLTVSVAIMNLSITLENLGVRFYFGVLYNKFGRAIVLALAGGMNMAGINFCQTTEICAQNASGVVVIVFSSLTAICGFFVTWPQKFAVNQ